MKDLILVLIMIPLMFGSCNKDDDDVVPNSSNTWTKTFGGNFNDKGSSVQQTTDSGYIITGTYRSSVNQSDLFLIKTEKNGDTLWTKRFGNEFSFGKSVKQTIDGGYIITGRTECCYVYLIKTDENGDSLWTKILNGSSVTDGWGNTVQQTIDGGYIIHCYYGGNDVYLIKTDENGNELWNQNFGQINIGNGDESVEQTIDLGYIITGSIESFGNGGNDVYLIKTDENGDSLWTKTFGGTEDDYGTSVQQTNDGGYIISGITFTPGIGSRIYLLKTNENGIELWNKTIGQSGYDYSYSVQQTIDGGYIIIGETYSGIGNQDVYLIKTDENGDVNP
tara:strand:+ start:144 stop:1148 length:1005 start_codon:yes stop_codon:yes gene_type:complete